MLAGKFPRLLYRARNVEKAGHRQFPLHSVLLRRTYFHRCVLQPFPYASEWLEPSAENLQKYCSGGFHPTHLGDYFQDGRYKIEGKLGSGDTATVWLAKDRLWVPSPRWE